MSFSKLYRKIFIFPNAKKKIKSSITTIFGKYLLITNTVTCGLLMFIGDILQQEIEYQKNMLPKRYDWVRIARMTLVGLGYGPLHHYFYINIHKLWPIANIQSVTKKILADQFLMSPVCIVYFFYVAGLLEFKKLSECTEELRAKSIELYTVDWCVWPPTQFVNFYYVPIKYQVLYINFVTMLYNVFLSYIKHREVAQEYLKNVQKNIV